MVADERERPEENHRRDRSQRDQGRIDPTRLVLIDETWARTNMAPMRGWAPKAERGFFGHWNTSSFIAALRHDRIDAPWVFDGPENGDIFRTYGERVLAPTLRRGDGQSRQPQEPCGAAGDPGGPSPSSVFITLKPGSEPDRTGLRQGRTLDAYRATTLAGHALALRGNHLQAIHTRRVH